MTEVAPKLPQTVRDGIVYVGEGISFERVRRITGYLVGTLDRFNNAKRAEEADRVKHG
ncbi:MULTISPECIES: anaerobic ribonucleoside-triphosphate reductase [Desulfovibrio]|uniref:anaerobic ribonucleoside-triphosphate reductase n=1 Tax=Desulfovibrio TaxID=872 RepID=UPI00195D56BF|nr:anaerobic ribonucleoside-triphosphate reductase [Desulfovibrio piger]MBM6894720.1 nrdD protein [Desulfovibrio piger]